MTAPRGRRPSPDGPSGTPTASPGGPFAERYELGERLGSGGAADVMRALDLTLGRPVAVKIFRPGGDPALEVGFAEEAALLARLQHPGLVTVYDAGLHERRAFLVMQLVEGQTLRQRIREEFLPPRTVHRLGERLASALAHVHATGIVHRDIKPSNILLDEAGEPHLTDFGIARHVDATTRTQSGMFTGTAAYMSPEQVRGDRTGPMSDIYALGLVLLECLTGELEYEGTPLESAIARLHRAPAIPEDAPADLRELLTSMTSTKPEERPDAATCAEWLGVSRTASRALPPRLPARQEPKRNFTARVPLAVLAALVVVLGAGLALTSPRGEPSRPSERAPATVVEPETSATANDKKTTPSSSSRPTSPATAVPLPNPPKPTNSTRKQPKAERPKENGHHDPKPKSPGRAKDNG